MMLSNDKQVVAPPDDDAVDLELMGRSLHTLDRCVQRLNLHCSILTSLKGLPPSIHLTLTEINVSSNCFTTCDFPDPTAAVTRQQDLDL